MEFTVSPGATVYVWASLTPQHNAESTSATTPVARKRKKAPSFETLTGLVVGLGLKDCPRADRRVHPCQVSPAPGHPDPDSAVRAPFYEKGSFRAVRP